MADGGDVGREGAEWCYAVLFKHSTTHETHLLPIGNSTDRGGLIVLRDQLHHALPPKEVGGSLFA